VVPACGEVSPRPCWQLAPNEAECPDVAGNLAIGLDRGGVPLPPDTVLEVRCAFAP
jgi:hypothetical protein